MITSVHLAVGGEGRGVAGGAGRVDALGPRRPRHSVVCLMDGRPLITLKAGGELVVMSKIRLQATLSFFNFF